MKRFSIGFTDEEYSKLESMRIWYEDTTGVRISRCAIIKRLLFDPSHQRGLFLEGNEEKSFKNPSKTDIGCQN